MFSRKSDLNRHLGKVHEENKPFSCEICDISFTIKQALENHCYLVHDKKKSYQCPNCDPLFSRKSDLNRHIRKVHEENKPFSCTTCGARFMRCCNLKMHIKTVHERKMPFICSTCRGKLNYHVSMVHEDQKLKKCDICEKSILNFRKWNEIKLFCTKMWISKPVCKKPFGAMKSVSIVQLEKSLAHVYHIFLYYVYWIWYQIKWFYKCSSYFAKEHFLPNMYYNHYI